MPRGVRVAPSVSSRGSDRSRSLAHQCGHPVREGFLLGDAVSRGNRVADDRDPRPPHLPPQRSPEPGSPGDWSVCHGPPTARGRSERIRSLAQESSPRIVLFWDATYPRGSSFGRASRSRSAADPPATRLPLARGTPLAVTSRSLILSAAVPRPASSCKREPSCQEGAWSQTPAQDRAEAPWPRCSTPAANAGAKVTRRARSHPGP